MEEESSSLGQCVRMVVSGLEPAKSLESRPLQQPVGVAMPVVLPARPVGPPSMSLGHPALPLGPRGYGAGALAQDLGQYGSIGQPVPHQPSGASGAWERLENWTNSEDPSTPG